MSTRPQPSNDENRMRVRIADYAYHREARDNSGQFKTKNGIFFQNRGCGARIRDK